MRNVLLNMSMSLDGYVAGDREHAAPMNEIPKVVFSKTLADADATWPTARVAGGPVGSAA